MAAVKRDMTVQEAVKHLPGMSDKTLQKWIRDAYMMKARPCPFAEAVLTDKGQWCYYVFPERLKAYIQARDLTLVADHIA